MPICVSFLEGVEKRVKETCISCNAPCDHIDCQGDLGKIKDFCCWCVPAHYITKPVSEWMCDECKNKIIREFLEEQRKLVVKVMDILDELITPNISEKNHFLRLKWEIDEWLQELKKE